MRALSASSSRKLPALALVVASIGLSAPDPASATPITVSLSASAPSLTVGDTVVLSVSVSGLDAGEALAAYNLALVFDTTVLAFDSADFQGFLGASISNAFGMGTGAGVLEQSLVPGTLVGTQPSSGILVNVVLQAVGIGSTGAAFNGATAQLIDQNGDNIVAVNLVALGTPIEVLVPEPGTALLLGAGLVAAIGIARRRR